MLTSRVVYFEVLHDGGTVNADCYLQFLETTIEFFSKKLDVPRSQLSIMHDNARPHLAQIVESWMCEKGVNWIKQPPYSPDFNLMDRYVFRNFETHRRRKDVSNSVGVSELISKLLDLLSPHMLRNELHKFCQHLAAVSESAGNCI